MNALLIISVGIFGISWSKDTSLDYLCKDQRNERHFLHPADCDKYIECIKEFAIIHTCPENTYFDPAKNICTSDPSVCKADRNARADPPPFTDLCYRYVPGVKIPHPSNKRKYIICDDVPEVKTCPSGLYFDGNIKNCNTADVGGNNICHSVRAFTYLPDTTSKYIECFGGAARIKECPIGLVFDNNEGMCNYPKRRSNLF